MRLNPCYFLYAPPHLDALPTPEFFLGYRGLLARCTRARLAEAAANRRAMCAYGAQRIGTLPTAEQVLAVAA